LARRILRPVRTSSLAPLAIGLSLTLSACKHKQAAPATSSSAAPIGSALEAGHEARFQSELSRARELWQEPPKLGQCTELMKEDGDRQLCTDAEKALAAVSALSPNAAPQEALSALGAAGLVLERLFERARYLSLLQLGRERMEADAGAKPAAAPASSLPASGSVPRPALLRTHDRRNLKLVEGPLGHLAQNANRLERTVLRRLAVYLEYGPLSVRAEAFERVQQLQAQHPQWPALHRLVREAAVLETNPELKAHLGASASPTGEKPDQTADSK